MDFLLPLPKHVHVPQDGKFQTPPMDGSLIVPEIYDWHYEHNPNHPVFAYPTTTGGVQEIPFSQVVPAAHRAARLVAKSAEIDLTADAHPPIAILAHTDTITYFTLMLGCLRAAIPVLPIACRFSVNVVVHLISSVRPSHIFVSGEPELDPLLRNALDIVQSSDPQYAPGISPMPSFEDLYVRDGVFDPIPKRKYDLSYPAITACSSGSTSLPKPIVWNVRSNLQTAIMPFFGKHNLCGQRFGCHNLPMSNGILINFIAWISGTGMVLATFPPGTSGAIITPEIIFKGFVDTQVSYAFGFTKIIEAWSRDAQKMTYLKSLKGLIYGGLPLNKVIGDFISNQGVSLYTLYGMTEAGVIGTMFPENLGGNDWDYFTFNPHCGHELIPAGEGLFELIIVSKPTQELTVQSNALYEGKKAYASNDLLIPHPEKKGYWKIVGRITDQITLSTGDKLNPKPFEDAISASANINGAVVFGEGRSKIGVLVEPKPVQVPESTNAENLEALINSIWVKVEQINQNTFRGAQLNKEMILIANPYKPFAYTLKGSPSKRIILQLYHEEIDKLYNHEP